MKFGVREKILVITVTTFLLAIAVNTLVMSQVFRKEYSDALQPKMDVIANTLGSQIERLTELGIAIDGIEGFEAQCQEILQKHKDVAYVMVTRTDGRILFHNDPKHHDTTINDPEILNATKYIDKPQGQIRIGCVEVDGFWKFSIADNGLGIEEKYFEKIFQMFQTLSACDEFESTGVGLSVVKKIVEMYGGKLWVESTMGEGSVFLFVLPSQEMGVKNATVEANTIS